MANINVYGTFHSMAEDQTVAKAAQIYDDNKLKNQQTINQELEEKIDNLEFSAEDISYDLTPTPDLGGGDVQSAIEALDGKVEQLSLDTMGKDESGEYWEELLYEKKGYSEISANNRRIGANHATTTDTSGVGRKIYIFPASEGDVFKVTGAAGSGDWTGFWKGGTAYSSITTANYLSSATVASGTYTAPANATLFAFVSIDARFTSDLAHVWKKTTRSAKTPADIQRQLIELENGSINTSALEVGEVMPYWKTNAEIHGKRIEVRKGQVLLLDLVNIAACAPLVFTDEDRVITEIHQTPVYGAFEVPNDGYAYIQKLISHESDNYLYIMGYGGHAKDMVRIMEDTGEVADQKIDDEKVEFIKERFPYKTTFSELYGLGAYNGAYFTNTDNSTTWTITAQSNTNYRCYWSKELIPKGTLLVIRMTSTVSTAYWRIVGYSTESPQDYYESHSNSIIGFVVTKHICATNNVNSTNTYTFTMPEDGYIVYTNINSSTSMVTQIYDSALLTSLYTEYYQKGVADGSAMASIVGLGYNIWDYISGAVNLAGFEYGCEMYKQYLFKPTVSLNSKWRNSTKMVYLPKFDMTGLPNDSLSVYRICQGCTTLQIVPDLTFASGAVYSFSETFQNCTNLLYFGNLENVSTANTSSMFAGCTKLIRVGRINTSGITTWRSSTANMMFYNCTALRRIEELDMTSSTQSAANWLVNSAKDNLRYVFLRNLGKASTCTAANMSYFTNWGIPNASYADTSDARQSLIDTLLTYSFDRATAEYSTCTITLSANTKALLTTEELEQITAKGYTIA